MAWDATKPAANSLINSAEVRGNFQAIEQAVGTINLLADPAMLIWPAGDSAAPAHWTLTGSGATVARTGPGLADTSSPSSKQFAAKVSTTTFTGVLKQSLLPSTAFDTMLRGKILAFGAFVKAIASNAARIGLDDGAAVGYSAYHTGDGTWQWLTGVRTVDPNASQLIFRMEVNPPTLTGYFSQPVVLLGAIPPQYPQRARIVRGALYFPRPGGQAVGTNLARFVPGRPLLITDVQLDIVTAPTGQALIVDVKTWDGAAYTSMFTSGGRPQIAAAANRGNAAPDGTYARRCLTGLAGSGLAAGQLLSVDVAQVGSVVAGSDLSIFLRGIQYQRPLEDLLGIGDLA